MAFKPVGIDENDLFPTRVLTALKGIFLQNSQASVVAKSGKYSDLTDKPSIPSTPNAVGAEPSGLSTSTKASLDAAYLTKQDAVSGYAPLTSLRPYGLAIGRSGCNVPIGLHAKSNAQGLSDGTSTSSSYRVFVPLSDPQAGSVLPVFPGWYAFENDVPNAYNVGAAVEARDNFGAVIIRPFTFSGAHLGIVNPGTHLTPDAPIAFGKQVSVTVTDALGTTTLTGVWMRFYASVASAGQKWPLAIDPRLVSGEGNNGSSGVDLTLTGSASTFSGAFSYSFGPAVVLGTTRQHKPIVGVVGDSLMEGSNDYVVTRGYVERALEAIGYPMVKVAKGGESASNFGPLAGRKYRMMLLDGCTHILCDYGTNDLVNRGQTPTQVQNNLAEIWAFARSIGAKVYQATITPRTSSTDSWTTPGNQTASGTGSTSLPADIAAVNSYIRTAASNGTIDGVLEVSDAVSTARDSGIWKSNTSNSVQEWTNDGTHPSPRCIVNTLRPLVQTLMATWTAS